MPFDSVNPATGELLVSYPEHDAEEVERRLALAHSAFKSWRTTTFAERAKLFRKLAELIRKDAGKLAELAAAEMGKPVVAGRAEADKCAGVCEFYADNAEKFLAHEKIDAGMTESYTRFDPIGAVLAIMPWNFPYWQVMRFAAPALMAGNVGLLKHASNVQGAALELEKLFKNAGFPDGVFQNLIIDTKHVEGVIRDPRVVAVTLTGSERAGVAVATVAGSELKKVVLELGGSDPFIILSDADIDKAATVAAQSRLQNTGQSCISAKRFIVEQSVAEKFKTLFKEKFEQIIVGDPMDEKTQMGPLVSERSLKEIEKQVGHSVEKGAKILTGGARWGTKGFFYQPTILTDVKKGMPAYEEEIFGPVASVIEVANAEEALTVANDTRFGLGANLWTRDIELAKKMARQIESGFVAINGMVKSDQRLPFGGVKKSGFGRELSRYGILEFVNIKTVTVA